MRRVMRDRKLCGNPDCDRLAVLAEVVELVHLQKLFFCSRDCREKWLTRDVRQQFRNYRRIGE